MKQLRDREYAYRPRSSVHDEDRDFYEALTMKLGLDRLQQRSKVLFILGAELDGSADEIEPLEAALDECAGDQARRGLHVFTGFPDSSSSGRPDEWDGLLSLRDKDIAILVFADLVGVPPLLKVLRLRRNLYFTTLYLAEEACAENRCMFPEELKDWFQLRFAHPLLGRPSDVFGRCLQLGQGADGRLQLLPLLLQSPDVLSRRYGARPKGRSPLALL
ncbi:MAG: hypothetical protein AAF851_13195 [Myxococcota bacterium]